MTMLTLDSLNANQRRAVDWNDGPMLVLAGPGAGKTRVLTTRVARLIQETPEKRFRVLALTFTTKAADEMRGRVRKLLGPDARRARLTTFHGFATDVLRQHGSHLGLRPDFTILNQDADRLSVLQDAIEDVGDAAIPSGLTSRGVLPLIDRLLREGQDGRESQDEAPPFSGSGRAWVRPIYAGYLRLLLKGNHLDFGALLVCCLRLFRERPRIARDYAVVYPFACVDEYQDTNRVQDLLLRVLYPDRCANLFLVADDDQTIYQWNGASPERLRRIRRDYDPEVVQLPESFRCPPDIVHLANNLIAHNVDRAPDKEPLVAVGSGTRLDVVRVRRFDACAAELSWIADDIKSRSVDPGSCTVLARSTKLVRAAATALSAGGLPTYVVQRRGEFESPFLRFVHSALRLANRPTDVGQLAPLCAAFRDLTATRVEPADAETESVLLGSPLLAGFLAAASSAAGSAAGPLLDTLRNDLVDEGRYREFLKGAFDWLEQQRRMSVTLADEDECDTWKSLTREIRQHLGAEPPLGQFLQQLDLRPKAAPPRPGDVQCLTIHLAKGKEFAHVYLVGLAEEQLPSFHAVKGGPAALEEERRSCFVAITRVQCSLTLTHADSYFDWPKQPSRFLGEMGLAAGERGCRNASTYRATSR